MEIMDFNMNLFSVKDKVVLITGGTSGLGQAYSVALATAGAKIYSVSLNDVGYEETKKMVEAKGGKIHLLQADITQDGVPQKAIDDCLRVFGSIDIMINNAGVGINKEFPNFDRLSWDKMIGLNLTAAYEFSNRVGKIFMEKKRGKIINTCSLYSFMGGQWSPAYAAMKHGLAGLTKAYCDELAQYNVQCNGIAPGYFKTPVTAQSQANPERNKWIIDHCASGRWGDVADLMGTVVFLASDASNFVNGTLVVVDGGYLVR